jgi:hypothetical protein
MVRFPEATKHSLEQRLGARRGARWPQLASIVVRHRANFTYVDGILPDGTTQIHQLIIGRELVGLRAFA